MTYSVKEMYYTLQGEGAQSGRPAVFLRFSGCNLWSGREKDRQRAVCSFCDTEFVGTDGPGGGKFSTAADLAAAVAYLWPARTGLARPYVVCTGGEPLLQLDSAAIAALQAKGFEVGVETNGTLPVPQEVDWICVSPKANAPLVQRRGNELKLVFPQVEAGAQPEHFVSLEFEHFFLQPLDELRKTHSVKGKAVNLDVDTNLAKKESSTQSAVDYCLANPLWKLSLQTHKFIGID